MPSWIRLFYKTLPPIEVCTLPQIHADGRGPMTDPRSSAFIRGKENHSRYCTRKAVTNCTPFASLTRNTLHPAACTPPTSALALPCASVVILAKAAHGVCRNRLHTAVLKV